MLARRKNALRASRIGSSVLCVLSVLSVLGVVGPPRVVIAAVPQAASVTPTAVTPTAVTSTSVKPRSAPPKSGGVAAGPGPVAGTDGPGVLAATPVATTRLISLDLHGTLRLRGQRLHNGGLGDGGSGVPATVNRLGLSGGGDDLSLVDVRLRLDPTLNLGSRARVDAQIDVSGGLVYGAKLPSSAVLSHAVGMFGDTAWHDLVAVRRAWATFELFGLAELVIGRTGDHFGLGIWRNDGRDPLSDFQSDVDRVSLRGQILGLRLMLARDTMATLPAIFNGADGDDIRYGLQDATDVVRWLAQVEGGAEKVTDKGLRWGFAVGYHSQTLGLRVEHEDAAGVALNPGCVAAGTCVQLVPREALMIVPQGSVGWRGNTRLGLLAAEAEAVMRLATFDNTDALPNTDTGTTLIGGALAGRVTLRTGSHEWRLRAGWASGDATGGFGVLDRANLAVVDPATKELVHRDFVTGMAMHRGFLVGGTLFREVIGAVANAWYARPSWRLALTPATPTGGVSVELGCLVAGAAQWGATPGKRTLLGVEPELQVDARLGRFGRGVLQTSYFLPGPAFDTGLGGSPAESAWRLNAAWVVDF